MSDDLLEKASGWMASIDAIAADLHPATDALERTLVSAADADRQATEMRELMFTLGVRDKAAQIGELVNTIEVGQTRLAAGLEPDRRAT